MDNALETGLDRDPCARHQSASSASSSLTMQATLDADLHRVRSARSGTGGEETEESAEEDVGEALVVEITATIDDVSLQIEAFPSSS